MGNLVANQAGLSSSESKGDGDIENQADKAGTRCFDTLEQYVRVFLKV
jgi:hypothetical protein